MGIGSSRCRDHYMGDNNLGNGQLMGDGLPQQSKPPVTRLCQCSEAQASGSAGKRLMNNCGIAVNRRPNADLFIRYLASRIEHPVPNIQYPVPNTQYPVPQYSSTQSPSTQYPVPNIQPILPSPQYILPSLPDGFFLEFVKPGADHGGDVGYDRIAHIRVFFKKLPQAFPFDFD